MKKMLTLLLAVCLALLLAACGNTGVPDDELRQMLEDQVAYYRENAEMTDMEVVSSELDQEGLNTVVAVVTSEDAFARYQDRFTLVLEYVESWKQWKDYSSDSTQWEPLLAEPKTMPTADEIPGIIEQSQEDGYGLLKVGEDADPITVMPDYTVGEPVTDPENAKVVTLLVPLQVDGQRYGWFVFHGTLQAKLQMWADTGEWQLSELTPGEGFDVTSVLDNRTYVSDSYELTMFGQDYPRQYTRTIHFGALDWDTMSFPGTTVTVTNLSEGGEETETEEAYMGGLYAALPTRNITVSAGGERFVMELPQDDAATLQEMDSDLLYTAQEAAGTEATTQTEEPQVVVEQREISYENDGEQAEEYTVEFLYDAAGNLARANNVDGQGAYNKYFYDAENRKTTEQFFYPDGSEASRKEFDQNGNVIRSIVGDNVTEYTYDDLGRCISISDNEGYEETYVYDDSTYTATGEGKSYLNGTEEIRHYEMTYDEEWRVLTERVTTADDVISRTYTYDEAGNMIRIFAQWEASGQTNEETYTYDAFGNMVAYEIRYNGVRTFGGVATTKPLSQAERVEE